MLLNCTFLHYLRYTNQTYSNRHTFCYGLCLSAAIILYYCYTENECEVDNGGCEQICLDRIVLNECACLEGYELNEDNQTCRGECVFNKLQTIIIHAIIL